MMIISGGQNIFRLLKKIDYYRKAIKEIEQYSYEELTNMSDNKIKRFFEHLGLQNKKLKYIKSVFDFLKKHDINVIKKYPSEQLINLIKNKIQQAGYKVGQCATLYLKGYHSGVMPVDSGMNNLLRLQYF
ncbi:MAG: hypothetical protein K9K32_04510 [Halanaerobiales bacterium]|nr:hypothetical protein [Halanaerobiales bacterium]